MATLDRVVESEWLYHLDQVQDGDGLFSVWIDQEERPHVFNRPQGCLLPDRHSFGLLTLSAGHTQRQGLAVYALAFLQFPRSSPECLLCFWSGLTRE